MAMSHGDLLCDMLAKLASTAVERGMPPPPEAGERSMLTAPARDEGVRLATADEPADVAVVLMPGHRAIARQRRNPRSRETGEEVDGCPAHARDEGVRRRGNDG
jgi:hypothetical protein